MAHGSRGFVVVTTFAGIILALACAADAVDPSSYDLEVASILVISPEWDTIAAVGGTTTLGAVLLDARGRPLSSSAVTWLALERDVLTLQQSSGPTTEARVIGLGRGLGRILAIKGSLSDTAYVAVAPGIGPPGVAAAILIQPETDTIPFIGGYVDLHATVLDVFGDPMPVAVVAWSSLDSALAEPDSVGRVTGVAGGIGRVVASYGVFSDTSSVIVDVPLTIPVRLAIAPKWAFMSGAGSRLLLSAAVYDEHGRLVANPPITWESLDSAAASVSVTGEVTSLVAEGSARVVAKSYSLADTAFISISTQTTWSRTPIQLMPVTGPLIVRDVGRLPAAMRTYDENYAGAEEALYQKFLACRATCLLEPNHYGALRSRLMWAIRNGEPIGPDANDPARHAYARGREIVHSYLQWAAPEHNKRPDQNTGLADAEAVWVLDHDSLGFNHVWGSAHRYSEDRFGYQNCTNAGSDPRQAAIALQAFNIAHRLKVPFQRFPPNGSGWDGSQGSWKATGERQIEFIRTNCVQPDGSVPSKAHNGREAFLFNAMVANELLIWARDVEFSQEYVDLARRIVDHLIDVYVTRHQPKGWPTLPYLTNSAIPATDLAGFYIWPSLVLWQETGDHKYYDFALTNVRAANKAYLGSIKQFNQTYSMLGMGAEALIQGVRWRQ